MIGGVNRHVHVPCRQHSPFPFSSLPTSPNKSIHFQKDDKALSGQMKSKHPPHKHTLCQVEITAAYRSAMLAVFLGKHLDP